jgi:transglutaminase-like putative cysteine protease
MIYKKALAIGDKGVNDTIELMILFTKKYAKQAIILQDLRINNLFGDNKTETIKKIFTWFVNNYRYVPDPENIELVRSPKWTIINKQRYGDCDDLSTALATYLLTAGIEVVFRTGAWKKETGNNFTHVWVLANNGKNWIALDPSAGINGLGHEVKWFRKKDYKI